MSDGQDDKHGAAAEATQQRKSSALNVTQVQTT